MAIKQATDLLECPALHNAVAVQHEAPSRGFSGVIFAGQLPYGFISFHYLSR